MLILWVKNSLTTDDKHNLRAFKTSYNYNKQDYGAAMFFIIVKMVRPETRAGCSDIKKKLETTSIYHFKHDIPTVNLHITECMNNISIAW